MPSCITSAFTYISLLQSGAETLPHWSWGSGGEGAGWGHSGHECHTSADGWRCCGGEALGCYNPTKFTLALCSHPLQHRCPPAERQCNAPGLSQPGPVHAHGSTDTARQQLPTSQCNGAGGEQDGAMDIL